MIRKGARSGIRKLLRTPIMQSVAERVVNLGGRSTSEVVVVLQGEHPRVLFPTYAPPGYLGQLEPAFQRRLANEHAYVELDDCAFYHYSELSTGEVIPGPWDLRGGEDEYLGGVDVAGKRVLELGPATGHLSFHMDARGAEVVGFDVGWDVGVDILNIAGMDMVARRDGLMRYVGAVQNSWWYLRRDRQSSAKIAYGNIYALPGDMGTFDIALFGCILLHLRDPYSALAQAARCTKGMIIVTDTIGHTGADPEENIIWFDPAGPDQENVWWDLSPGAVRAMLRRLGFGNARLTFHHKKHYMGHDMTREPVDLPMYTLVAERTN